MTRFRPSSTVARTTPGRRGTLACLALAAAVGAGSLPAQRPSSWASTSAPQVSPSAVQHRGKILFFRLGDRVHAFSAIHRRWVSEQISNQATLHHANDWLLVQEPTRVAAFSSILGRFETVAVGAGAFIVNPVTQRNDSIVLVRDGAQLHAFCGLTGGWTTRVVSPNAAVATQRDVAILAEGRNLWGMSAMSGAWVPHAMAEDLTSIAVDGTVGVVEGATTVHAFSAIRDSWAATTAVAARTFRQVRNVAVWWNASECLAFSGVRGAFDRVTTSQRAVVTTADNIVLAAAGSTRFHLFSAPLGTWTTVVTPAPATPTLGSATAALTLSDRVVGYSALSQTTATLMIPGPTTVVNTTLAAAIDRNGAGLSLYSAMTGRWHVPPAGAGGGMPGLARTGALLRTASGHTAFSARTGRFSPLVHRPNALPHIEPESSIIAIEDGSTLSVFESRRDVWLTASIPGGIQALSKWRSTLVAVGATEALGYGSEHGVIERVSLPGAAVDQRASSEVGAVITSDAVLGFGAVPALMSFAQFPEFRRMATRGARLDLHLVGPPGAGVAAAAGIASGSALTLPLGELLLIPQTLIPLPGLNALDNDGIATLPIPVPDSAALAGLELGFQAVVLPSAGTPYLTRLHTVVIQ